MRSSASPRRRSTVTRVENPFTRAAATGPGTFMDARGEAEVVRDSLTLLSPDDGGATSLTVGYTTLYPNSRTNGHAHEDLEEVYHIVRGRALMTIDDETFEVVAGDTYRVPPKRFHTMRNPYGMPAEMFWVLAAVAPATPQDG
jgi:mannose-6-phosphate isomerase-like protein (cupin superfamily)